MHQALCENSVNADSTGGRRGDRNLTMANFLLAWRVEVAVDEFGDCAQPPANQASEKTWVGAVSLSHMRRTRA
jgi:hypothetical protein